MYVLKGLTIKFTRPARLTLIEKPTLPPVRLQRPVYTRHGHELMAFKSETGSLTEIMLPNDHSEWQTTSEGNCR